MMLRKKKNNYHTLKILHHVTLPLFLRWAHYARSWTRATRTRWDRCRSGRGPPAWFGPASRTSSPTRRSGTTSFRSRDQAKWRFDLVTACLLNVVLRSSLKLNQASVSCIFNFIYMIWIHIFLRCSIYMTKILRMLNKCLVSNLFHSAEWYLRNIQGVFF